MSDKETTEIVPAEEELPCLDLANIPRRERPNPNNYTALEIAERDLTVDAMLQKHPTLPRTWLEYVYDLCKNKPEEEIKEIINTKAWEKPIKERLNTGVIKSVEIINPDHPDYMKMLEKNPGTVGPTGP